MMILLMLSPDGKAARSTGRKAGTPHVHPGLPPGQLYLDTMQDGN